MFAALASDHEPAEPPRPRKPRAPNISKMIERAEKATGKAVTAVTLPDGTRLDFNKPTNATADDEVESWLSKQKGH